MINFYLWLNITNSNIYEIQSPIALQITYFTVFNAKEPYSCINFFLSRILHISDVSTFVCPFIHFLLWYWKSNKKHSKRKGNERKKIVSKRSVWYSVFNWQRHSHTHYLSRTHTLNPILFLLRLWLIIITSVVVVVVFVAFVERTTKESHMLDTQTLNIKFFTERDSFIHVYLSRVWVRKRKWYIWMMNARQEPTPEWDNFHFRLNIESLGTNSSNAKNAFDWLISIFFVYNLFEFNYGARLIITLFCTQKFSLNLFSSTSHFRS